jgi:hypothetical protein
MSVAGPKGDNWREGCCRVVDLCERKLGVRTLKPPSLHQFVGVTWSGSRSMLRTFFQCWKRVFETAPPTLPAIPIIANIFVVLIYNGFTLMTRQREDARSSPTDPRAPNREAKRLISLIKPPVTTRPMIASQMLTVNPSEQDQSRLCCIVCRCQCFFIGSLYPIAHA